MLNLRICTPALVLAHPYAGSVFDLGGHRHLLQRQTIDSASATSSEALIPSARASLESVLMVGWFCPSSISEMKFR